jgi:hypothetical protein
MPASRAGRVDAWRGAAEPGLHAPALEQPCRLPDLPEGVVRAAGQAPVLDGLDRQIEFDEV